MSRFLLLIVFLFLCGLIKSQSQPAEHSALIFQKLKKLNVVGSVLYIAAHPDDENTRLLSFLANEKKLRTGYLSLTRGDGGQNLIGKEQGEALGLIRTNELLAARSIDGAEQFFTRANDFGYSKNPEETFSIWNKDSLLYDVVLTIRKFKPDVIICRFPTTGEGGHGHHTASAIIAEEAFMVAADSNIFPDQLKFVDVWQPKSLFWNTFNFGTTNTTSPNQLQMDVGQYNVLLGKSYGEIASESRSMHKSQGFGSARQRGSNIEYFKQLKGDTVKNDLFQNVNSTWSRFPNTSELQKQIDECIKKYNIEKPQESLQDLIKIYQYLISLTSTIHHVKTWRDFKLKQVEELIISCSGIWLEANTINYSSVPGENVVFNINAIARNQVNAILKSVTFFDQTDTMINLPLVHNKWYSFKHQKKLAESIPLSNPYWLNTKPLQGMYHVKNVDGIGVPLNKSMTKVQFRLTINDFNLTIEKELVYKSTDPVKGEVYRAFEILPLATINFSEKVIVFPELKSKSVRLIVKSNTKNFKGVLRLNAGYNCKVLLTDSVIQLSEKGDEKIIEATIIPQPSFDVGSLDASIHVSNYVCNSSIQRIEYDHIPYQFILSKSQANLIYIQSKKTISKIGYIIGAGDDIPQCLSQLGYQVVIISDEQLVKDNLNQYDAIVTGVRAYNTLDRLQIHHSKLMSYVENGGNLIVQYNTNNRIGPVIAKIGPYPFTISRDRVTDEKAKVTFTKPAHPVFNYPNKILDTDFDNWVQERGIYFVSDRDKSYESFISMNDPGEKPTDGSLIVAKYGKGNFVYTGLSFFRQLPAGVPGAYKLFVNLMSLPKNK